LSAADLRGPTTTTGSGPVPVSPARAGMLGGSKDLDEKRGCRRELGWSPPRTSPRKIDPAASPPEGVSSNQVCQGVK
jgi:hypothetical protein